MKRPAMIVLAFFTGVGVALSIAYVLAAQGRPPGGRGVGWIVAVLHPFLRLPGYGDGGVFATSIAFNGLYYAAALAIVSRLGRGFVRVAAAVALVVVLRFALLAIFDLGVWLVRGEMSHAFIARSTRNTYR